MAKTKISQYDATAGNNTDIDSISIAEGMAPSNVNNAIRELMAHLKDMDAGTQALTSPQLTSVDINGGSIDGAVIGANSAAAITGTTITGTSLVIGSANINENDFESIDGITAGTVAASKAVIVDANKDVTGFRNVTLTGELDAATLDVSGDIDVDGTANLDVVDIDGAVDMASTLAVAGVVTANAGVVVDNITIDGTEIDLSSGDLTLDVAGDIILDADGGDIFLNNAGTTFAKFTDNSGHLDIFVPQTNGDILFKGNDDGATITALTLDMSDAGTAIFNHDIFLPDAGEIQLGNGFDFRFFHDGSNNYIKSVTSDQDIIIQGNDGGNIINALTLDMSDAGTATFNHDVKLGDNSKALFGASSDLEIFHDGTDSVIKDAGSGSLEIRATDLKINNSANSKNMIKAIDGAAVELYHNGSKKLETASGGITVTGEVAATSATITTADNTATLTLASTDADANVGPLLVLNRNSSSPADGDRLGSITFIGENDADQEVTYATFRAFAADVSDGTEDTEFEFTTILAGSEVARMTTTAGETVFNQAGADINFRVEGSGLVNLFKVDAGAGSGKVGINCDPTDLFYITGQATSTAMGIKIGTNGYNGIEFDNATGSLVGRITINSGSTAYVTSSDYRLKENVTDMTGATTRLKQLKPKRFNWIADDTNTLIDGFLAHEVSSVVPEAVAGEKDAVHPDGHHEAGEIDPQGLDYSKLVPLLVKTIQELEARITTLEG